MDHTPTRLDDKYTQPKGRVYLNGYQAIARLAMLQRARDQAAGLNTAGFISGYRGSPLGGLDRTLWEARPHLESHHIVFQPGVNEDLAATAIWGSQQVNLFPGARYDGVFALWYGKGPGVDRCGDVFHHGNAAGTSPHGGVLLIAGDDHAARSSTLPHQTDHFFKAMMIPVLAPAGIQEYLDYGLHGWAMSRYSGCWVAFKATADTVETSASVDIDPARVQVVIPTDVSLPPDGLSIRWPDPPLAQERRLVHHRLYAALAYCRANHLNQVVLDSPQPRLGILTAGKSYLDVRQALDDLGIDAPLAAALGLRVYKVGMVWPLEAEGVRHFAEGLEEILVVEEKRQLLEYQLKEELYNWREDVRPRVIGKFDEKGEWALPHGDWLLPAAGELSPALIARVIAQRIGRYFTSLTIRDRLALIDTKEGAASRPLIPIERRPHYCPGCPHNTSTQVPDGSRALAGIGCHYMATWINPRTATICQMGGEGVPWIGQAPFTDTRHVFANLGDGTYYHSGLLAIRAAIAARVNITYKILFNDAVAMTGGQPVDGPLTPAMITRQLAAEGVETIRIVTDAPEKYAQVTDLAPGVSIHHRDALDALQKQLRAVPGVSALIYDQTCAAEKRRRRKRGTLDDPPKRLFINPLVCEGCGDCSSHSNCLAIEPLETPLGRKRVIDQHACNKDYSCLKGHCPAFIEITGGRLRRGRGLAQGDIPLPPEPALPSTRQPYNILVAGIGGTGIVTLGALIGMAAHLDGKAVTVVDMTGLAQKGGSVISHIRLADRAEPLHAVRIATGEADVVIAGDIVVAASNDALLRMAPGRTRVLINSAETATAEFTHNPDWPFPLATMTRLIQDACGEGNTDFVDASRLAAVLLGEGQAVNLFLLGMAWQQGLVPVSLAALQSAIRLNGVAIENNLAALDWGRRMAHHPADVLARAQPEASPEIPDTLEGLVAHRAAYLVDYQDAAYAQRYRQAMEALQAAEVAAGFPTTPITLAAARHYFHLLAYKDEYEVARLHTHPSLKASLDATFEGDYQLHFHLAPAWLSRPDPATGLTPKRRFGPWIRPLFRLLASLKGLRGTWLDIFGYQADRQQDRAWLGQYEDDLAYLRQHLPGADPARHAQLLALAEWPATLRGYGTVRSANAAPLAARRKTLRNEA